MTSQSIRKMVVTAILIALTIVFQLLRPVLGGSNIISTYIIGSLVNLVLIIAACAVGLWSGVAVAVVAPLFAVLQNHAQLPMVPWIIAGNLVLVVLYALFARQPKTLKGAVGSLDQRGRCGRAAQVCGYDAGHDAGADRRNRQGIQRDSGRCRRARSLCRS